MDQQTADRIITEYLPKIYSFAAKRSFGYDETEELCAELVGEVYLSLRKEKEIVYPDRYIYRVCSHVYAKFVASKKRREGISADHLMWYEEAGFLRVETGEELRRLRREIGFLSRIRREIVYSFYFENKSIAAVARETGLPVGTVKWHLNKARNELKGGIIMERKTGRLGIHPIEAIDIGHSGMPGSDPPEHYLSDPLNLNLVYSVYHTPLTAAQMAEELGVSPVYLEDRISSLEENGFLVPQKGGKYTTYVRFSPERYSLELQERILKKKLEAAEVLAREYAPAVRSAVADFPDVYIPGGNTQLLEAAAVFYGVIHKCCPPPQRDLSRYHIKTKQGSDYIATVWLPAQQSDLEYQPTLPKVDYDCRGAMTRQSEKYGAHQVRSWSVDTRYSSRIGGWRNNRVSDYEYLYEWLTGALPDIPANAEKLARLHERAFLTSDGKVNIMTVKGDWNRLFDRIPPLSDRLNRQFADFALEEAEAVARDYPPQMQELVLASEAGDFIGNTVALMVLDILYGSGAFRPLTENERVTSLLLFFSDILPEA